MTEGRTAANFNERRSNSIMLYKNQHNIGQNFDQDKNNASRGT